MAEGQKFEIDLDDLEPSIDLTLKLQERILQLNVRLAHLDHYALLGVSQQAEKKQIRSAYFDLMNVFHEDKYYGKELGSFRLLLRNIVEQLTRANNTLTRKKTRLEYDSYLASRQTTLGARNSIAPAPVSAPDSCDEPSSTQPESSGPYNNLHLPPPPKAPEFKEFADLGDKETVEPAPQSESQLKTPAASVKASRAAARRMLARKMGRAKATTTSTNSPQVTREQVRKAAKNDLRSRYEARKNTRRSRTEKYRKVAAEARASGDWAAAVNSIGLATESDPDDTTLSVLLDEYQKDADRALAPKFVEQAKYEEKDARFERAARSYERAARGKESPDLFNKAAQCLLKAGKLEHDDERKLVELARSAVRLDNTIVTYRLTLARAYDSAGMKSSALGEISRALELEPEHEEAKQLQKELK